MNQKEYHKQYYEDHREEILKNTKQYRKNNLGKRNEYQKQWCKDNPKKMKNTDLKGRYGLTYEDWLEMWEIQDGKCAVCGESFTKPSDGCVDHWLF
ncbi:MAG TPA: hypothetical protein VMX17_11250 [Candidatus Glassbacteria bacterium]|nr:hypothetical protein [Candidatus Glassbacteria bacterium]